VADKDIKQRIVLEGEKEYSNALKEAQRNLKVLRSELKAESAELGKNATEQQKAEAKLKNLNKQIKEQEKVVRTYEKALEEVREKYGDNEDAVAKWEVKLNDARATLANMKNSLDETGQSMKSIGDSTQMGVVAANSLADSFGKVADAGGMISGAIEEAFKSVVGTIADTVSQVWESVVDLAARSNNIVDLAGFWNTDPTKIQQWAGAVAFASGSLEDIASIVTKINAGDAKKIAELTGVSDVNYQDRWEYAMAVMDSLSKMSKLQRNEAAFEIFGGKQATKAFDLLNDWNTVLEHLSDFDAENGGFGLSEDQLQNMSDLYDKVNGLKASWQALKDMATVELFGDLALNITGNLQNIVEAFKDYFNAEDDAGRQAAIDKIKENIVAIFEEIKNAINAGLEIVNQLADELKNSDDSVLQILGNLLGAIVDGLEWFMDPSNWETVKKGFEAIIGVWATGKILSALGNMATFGAHLATIGKFFGWGNGAANVAADAAGTAVTAGGGSAIGGLLTGIMGLAGVGAIAQGFVWAADRRLNHPEDVRGTDQNLAANTGGDETLKNAFIDYVTVNRELQDMMDHGMFDDDQLNAMLDKLDEVTEALNAIEGAEELLKSYSDWRQEHSYGNMDWELPADWWTNKNQLTSDDISGFRTLPKNISAAVSSGVSNIKVTLDGYTVGRLVAPYVSEMIARDMVI
jgi:hypothetical protein